MTTSQIPYKAGVVELRSVIITGTSGIQCNVLNQVCNVTLYENIFSPFLTGSIVIEDGQNISSLFPLTGNELVEIEIATPISNGDINKISSKFLIHRCRDKIEQNHKSLYILDFISPEAINNYNNCISKTYTGNTVSIIGDIFETYMATDKPLVVEQSVNSIKYISNWWTPIKNIEYVCKRSKNKIGDPSFLFYEAREGFRCHTLSTLLSNPATVLFSTVEPGQDAQPMHHQTMVTDIIKDYIKIQQITFEDQFNLFERIKSGYYGSLTFGFDSTTQQYSAVVNYNIDNTTLNNYSPTYNNVVALPSIQKYYVPVQTHNFDGVINGTENSSLPYEFSRQQKISRLSTNVINIKVAGLSNYHIGQVAVVNLVKSQQINDDDIPEDTVDQIWSGRYLITAIKHNVNPDYHECEIQLMKDSYAYDVFGIDK